MTTSNSGMKMRTRRGFSTCNIMVERIGYKCSIISVSRCSHLLAHILPHIQTHFHYTKYRVIPHPSPFTPKTLFPLHLSFQISQGASFTRPVAVFLPIVWDLSPHILTYLQFHSPQENVTARRKEGEKELGIVEQGFKRKNWESLINRDSDLVAHVTKLSTFFDNISMILP